jgi:diguanylate cyclase (GGDEF)-like protein
MDGFFGSCARVRRLVSGMIPPRRLRKRLWSGTVLLLALLLGCPSAVAASGDPWAPFVSPWFDNVDVAAGLPHSITTAVAQDSRGLIWIGTMGGLVRYDGYRMQLFEAATRHKAGLPDPYVRDLLALPDGGMLIGTDAGGLARFDPADNSFHVYSTSRDGATNSRVYSIADDRAGGAWIATNSGLDHLDLRTGTMRHEPTEPGMSARDFSVLQDRAGNVWLGNDNGLFVRRRGSAAFVRVTAHGDAAGVLTNQIWAIYEDGEGRLWAGSGQAGAAYRDRDGTWHGVPGFYSHPHGAQEATVRDFLEASANRMWIATDGNGVLEYSPGDDHFRTIEHDPALPSSLPGNAVRALQRDRAGNIWVATDLGVARNDPVAHTAFSVLPSPLEERTLSDTNVHGVYVDSRQRIWLGLGAGHIDLIDLKAGTMRHLNLGGSQAKRDVQSFSEAPDGTLWVGTLGLARIDPDTLQIQESILPAIHDQPVLSLQANGSRMLIGTYEGIYRYDTGLHTLEHFSHVPTDRASLASDTVRQITRVGADWWFGTTRGISIAHDLDDSHGFVNLSHDPNDPASLPQNYVGSIASNGNGQAWVSTYGGVGILDQPAPDHPYRFTTVGAAQGLASDKVSAVLSDDRGQLWASLSNGVAKIDGRTHAVQNLGTRDGLHILSYIHTAAAHAPDGSLMFGGLGGLTVIRPYLQEAAATNAPLAITQAVFNGRTMPFGKLPRHGNTITLDARSRNLRLDFSLLDYKAPLETSYSYRMDGLDDSWTSVSKGSLPSAIYTNLPHGSYRLRLRAVTRGMRPQKIETDLKLVVEPRWYETVTAQIVAIVLLLALFAGLVHLRTLYLRRQAKALQRQIDEHTRDLRSANQRLDELAGTDGLTGAYNRRRFLELAASERGLSEDNRPVCILLFDLDGFKQINDTYGHLAGDLVIRTAIQVIKQYSRASDVVGRYGGEEFVLCLPDTQPDHARETAERIRDALASTVVLHEGQPISVTVSIGIATLRPGESIEQWLSRADKALYEAKRNGRNRCVESN